jgi:hypothetical protein
MTIVDPRSDKARKVEPASPEMPHPRGDRDFVMLIHEMGMPFTRVEALADAYRSWELAIEELHAVTVRLLQDDHA